MEIAPGRFGTDAACIAILAERAADALEVTVTTTKPATPSGDHDAVPLSCLCDLIQRQSPLALDCSPGLDHI